MWVGCASRSEEHTSELQSPCNLVCRLLLEKKKNNNRIVNQNLNAAEYLQLRAEVSFHPRLASPSCPCIPACLYLPASFFFFFFFNDTATTEIYTLSLHDALPI